MIVDDNTHFARRYDMIAFCSGTRTFPAVVFTPDDRGEEQAKGINSRMLNDSIINFIGPHIGAYDQYPLRLLCDRSSIHNTDKMKESFIEGHCNEIVDIRLIPAKSAKRLSPLDNGIFHEWKERCRRHHPLTKSNIVSVMTSEWDKVTEQQLQACYHHCGLTYDSDPYADCPLPQLHKHAGSS